ncbi:sensor histidine kinase [Pseudobacteriovorax antillogorgiicola]|uniref:histidine kinase n=1 Tax=Pseudobacteriovorax antillogorgiicola TaxID=1513793 RepID=A0A1Y6BS25_9BACT|nr:ATP-binding protein [Pseudobacteriovorax antillogorgiicola]TCS54642.1 PAS domain S-box-containing protein [Pseudobacteriovorax antillogorgiicola]SMF17021.1 PAS domain S-box-containing protein [Pseudobacteriovorax antillogorgiicola]
MNIGKDQNLVKTIVDAMPAAIIIVDSSGSIRFVNDTTLNLFGYQEGELDGRKVEILVPIAPRKHQQYVKNYLAAPRKRRMGGNRDLVGKTKEGQDIAIEVGLTPLEYENELYVIACAVDISERVAQMNLKEKYLQSIEEMNVELHRSNQDLSEFAYIASHDLQSPLRSIEHLVTWIKEDLENPNEDVQKNLATLESRVQRMKALLSDLLQYSRVSRMDDSIVEVPCQSLVEEIIESLDKPSEYKIKIDGSLPSFQTARAPLDLVLRNLIGNAIRHRDKDDGQLCVSCRKEGSFYYFTVSDNGKGIASQFHEKVFQLFQTLQSRDEIEGTGIGLAIVQKAVNRFGGEVTLVSEEGKGASFTFSWPTSIKGLKKEAG